MLKRPITIGYNPLPLNVDAYGYYHVVLGTVNAQSVQGQFLKGDELTVRRQMDFLVGQCLGEYRFSRLLRSIPYGPSLRNRAFRHPCPGIYKLITYRLKTHEDGRIDIMGVIQPTDPCCFRAMAQQQKGLYFSMRNTVSLQGETRKLRTIIGFDLEPERVIKRVLI